LSNSFSDSPARIIRLDEASLDSDGGCRLEGLAGDARIVGGGLRALAVRHSPELTGLDLGGCGDGLRLHLCGLPNLKWVRLPAGAAGAFVELTLLAAYRPAVPLVFGGPVADFTLRRPWAGRAWRLVRRSTAPPVNGLAVGPPAARAPGQVEAFVISGRACRGESLTVHGRGLSHLAVLDGRMSTLTLNEASLERLEVWQCPRLQILAGRFQARRAELSTGGALNLVGGSGLRLDVSRSKSPVLTLQGRWLGARVARADCKTLKIKHPVRLELDNLPATLDIDSDAEYRAGFNGRLFSPPQLARRLAARPGDLTRFVRRAGSHIGDRSRLATHWLLHLSRADGGRHVPDALRALNSIADCEEDREACWLIRCRLAAQRAADIPGPRDAFRRGSSRWDWADAARHGLWLNDVALYSKCADLDVVRPFRRTLRRADRLVHAYALAAGLAASRRGQFKAPDELLDFLGGCLARMNLADEIENRYGGLGGRDLRTRSFFSRAPTGWTRFVALLEALTLDVASLQNDALARLLRDRLIEVGDARFLLEHGCFMQRANAPHWREILQAGLEAPGQVPASVLGQARRLLEDRVDSARREH